jgi:hypothetical protein
MYATRVLRTRYNGSGGASTIAFSRPVGYLDARVLSEIMDAAREPSRALH